MRQGVEQLLVALSVLSEASAFLLFPTGGSTSSNSLFYAKGYLFTDRKQWKTSIRSIDRKTVLAELGAHPCCIPWNIAYYNESRENTA
jgi:hypothetical protein